MRRFPSFKSLNKSFISGQPLTERRTVEIAREIRVKERGKKQKTNRKESKKKEKDELENKKGKKRK